MKNRKLELKNIMLDIIYRREATTYCPDQEGNLLHGVAEVLKRRAGKSNESENLTIYPQSPELDEDDKLLCQEVFWDLIIDRVITPGSDGANLELPFFRRHSEAPK